MIGRRWFLAGAGALPLGCLAAPEGEGDDVNSGIPPWHMWGSTQMLQISDLLVAGSLVKSQTAQIADIRYKRPETWTFLLTATLVGVTGAPINGIRVDFALTLGLGRANIRIPTFAFFEWSTSQMVTELGIPRVLQQVELPAANSSAVTPNRLDRVAAETIQCVANSVPEGANAGCVFSVACSAFFVPVHHARPEWFLRHFPGGEEK